MFSLYDQSEILFKVKYLLVEHVTLCCNLQQMCSSFHQTDRCNYQQLNKGFSLVLSTALEMGIVIQTISIGV